MGQNMKTHMMAHLRAGVGRREISTHIGKRRVNDPLYAKTLVLDDGNTKVAIVAMDAVAIGGICDIQDDFLDQLRSRIQSELGIDAQNVLVNATHTHTAGPMLCENQELLDRTFEAIHQACQNMAEAKVGSGMGYEDRIMINRTLRLKNGLHWTIRQANPCPPDDDVEELGPVDPYIGILRIDSLNGQILAVVYIFSCHPLLGVPDGSVTANFPGFASKIIEEQLDTTALFLQGTGGDIMEVLYKDFNRPMDSEPVGRILALSTLKALKEIKPMDTETDATKISVITETIDLPRRTDIPRRMEVLKEEQQALLRSLRGTSLNFKTFLPLYIKYTVNRDYPSDYSYRYLHAEQIGSDELVALDEQNRKRIAKYLSNIYAMEKLARIEDKLATLERHLKINRDSGADTVKAEITGVKIGDFVIITAPAEVLVEVGLNIRKRSPFKKTFVVSPTNGYMHYGAPASYYDKGGYEVTECFLGEGWQDIFEEKAKEIIARL